MSDPDAPYRPPPAYPPPEEDGPVPAPPGYGPAPAGNHFRQVADDRPGDPARAADPAAAADRAARRASVALVAFVCLELLAGALAAFWLLSVPPRDWLPADSLVQIRSSGVGEGAFQRRLGLATGGCYFAVVLALLVLFAFVRKGSRGGAVTALALVGLLTLMAGLQTLFGGLGLLVAAAGTTAAKAPPPGGTGFAVVSLACNAALAAAGITVVVLLANALSSLSALSRRNAAGG